MVIIRLSERDVLSHAGKVSHEAAIKKAELEYDRFHEKHDMLLTSVGRDFDKAIGEIKKITGKQVPKTTKPKKKNMTMKLLLLGILSALATGFLGSCTHVQSNLIGPTGVELISTISGSAEVSVLSKSLESEVRAQPYLVGCPIPLTSLRLVSVDHYDFEGQLIHGEILVHQKLAAEVREIFELLRTQKFPIRSLQLIDRFDGSDEASMAADNSSAFNCRLMTEKAKKFSLHAYGVAVDINPRENPYVKKALVLPEAGKAFLDRRLERPGMITKMSGIYKVFRSYILICLFCYINRLLLFRTSN